MISTTDLTPANRRRARERTQRIKAWAFALSAYAFALTVGGGVASVALAPPDPESSAWGETTARIERAKTKSAELSRRLAVLESSLRAERAAGGRPDWSLLLSFIAREASGIAVLDHLTIDLHPDASRDEAFVVTLRGRAAGASSAAQFAVALERSGVFQDVRQGATGRARDGQAANFEIEARIGTPVPKPEESEEGPEG
ncbi:MAG: hypothetical protein AAGI53_08150 [Planctomycetota bacterium]